MEMACPARTMDRPSMPDGRWRDGMGFIQLWGVFGTAGHRGRAASFKTHVRQFCYADARSLPRS